MSGDIMSQQAGTHRTGFTMPQETPYNFHYDLVRPANIQFSAEMSDDDN